MDLSICIIYSQEDEHWLNDCVASVPIGSEVCLLKTVPIGSVSVESLSSNRTLSLAGCTVKMSTWHYAPDDFSFSKARNACKELATKSWILSLDADERIISQAGEFEHLDELSDDVGGMYAGLVSNYYPHAQAGGQIKREVIRCLRLFRNLPEINYKYRCHEDLGESIEKSGRIIVDAPTTIFHLGYFINDKDLIVKKLWRNMALMFKDLAEMPNDVHLNERACSHYITLMSLGEVRPIQT